MFLIFILPFETDRKDWGFHAHRIINQNAVFALPADLASFYKSEIKTIVEYSVKPDQRRYVMEKEGPRHFMDLDKFPEEFLENMPVSYSVADSLLSEDFLQRHGNLYWNLITLSNRLTSAFSNKDHDKILKYSGEIGHYLADANVPLHTVSNYNGQETGQHGIHSLWETRIPELYYSKFNLLTGKAQYIQDLKNAFWEHIIEAHSMAPLVLEIDSHLQDSLGHDFKYGTSRKGMKVSREYAEIYRNRMGGMVEEQMRKSIKLISDTWYTCWVNAGLPELN